MISPNGRIPSGRETTSDGTLKGRPRSKHPWLAGPRKVLGALIRIPIGAAGVLIIGALILAAILAPYLPLRDPLQVAIEFRLEPPSAKFLFGTDETGRDILSRLIWGARSSLTIGVSIVAIGLTGGVLVGLIAGYKSGTLLAEFLLRLMDIFAAIPLLVWAIAVVGIFGSGQLEIGPMTLPSEAKLVLLVGILFIPGLARVAHSLALAESKAEYVAARKLQGVGSVAIMVGDVLPNILAPMIVQASVLVGVGIIIEASLGFIGLGVQPPAPSWGGMLADAKTSAFSAEWWLSVLPGLAIFAAVIGFNLLGDAMRTVLDPRRQVATRQQSGAIA